MGSRPQHAAEPTQFTTDASETNEPRRQRSLAQDIVAIIETEIVEGILPPGHKLDEVVLADRFNVSRTPIREALRSLTATGLVAFQPRLGAIVARPTVGEVMDLFELVAELEGVAARLACERMDSADELAIVKALEACRAAAQAIDPGSYYAANGRFHRTIHKAARNHALDGQIELLDKRLSPYRRFITLRPGRTETALREHDGIAAAIAARNGTAAAVAMRDHVRVLAEDSHALVKSLRF